MEESMALRILVADDNRDALSTYVKVIQSQVKSLSRIEVEQADTVAQAIGILRTRQIDLLVVDLKMPGSSRERMGGLEIISASRIANPSGPVIVITGYGTVELARKTLTQGAIDFIEKSATAAKDLAKAVQSAIENLHEKLARSGNPFTPMTGIEPTVFGGRRRELEFFEKKLTSALRTNFCEHFLVLGNWGIGKSTLLKEYKKICQSRGHIATIVPLEALQPGTSVSSAALSIVLAIMRNLPLPINRLKKATQFLQSIGFNVLGFGISLSRDTSRGEVSPQALLHDSLLRVWQDLEGETEVLVILLDDLDNFAVVPEIVTTLKQTLASDSMMKTKILLGMASSSPNWLRLTSSQRHHPLSRYFLSRVELSTLSKAELRDTIIGSLGATGVSFNREVIEKVFEYTSGHPFEMQVLCHQLFDSQISRRVEMDVWEKALQAAISEMGVAVFDQWYGQASGEERKVLRILAGTAAPKPVGEIREMCRLAKLGIVSRNVPKYLQRLAEKEIVSKVSRGLYTVPDPMFRAYIRSQAE
jgi:CheY-like chemotaxis protein